MFTYRLHSPMAFVVMIACAVAAPPVQAGDELSWKEVELVAARGVPNETEHEYYLRGVLLVVEKSSSSGFSLAKGGFYSTSSSRVKYAVWVEASGTYDTRERVAVERIEFEGDFEGQMVSELRCNDDPWLDRGTQGVVIKSQIATEADSMLPFDSIVRSTRQPLTIYGVDAAHAEALSREAANRPGPPPPPPPPPPKPKITAVLLELKNSSEPAKFGPIVSRLDLAAPARASAGTMIEGESLIGARAKASAGSTSRQDMAQFGSGWSGNAQLFWNAPGPGAELTLKMNHATGGAHQLAAYVTQAPDFAIVQFYTRRDGTPTPVGRLVDGYAPRVVRSQRIVLGNVELDPGDNELVVKVAGKSGTSRGYYFGLDALELGAPPEIAAAPARLSTAVRVVEPGSASARANTASVGLNPQPEPPSAWSGQMTVDQFVELYRLVLRDLSATQGVKLKVELRPDRPLTPEQEEKLKAALREIGLQ